VDATKIDIPVFASLQGLFAAVYKNSNPVITPDHKDTVISHDVALADLHQYLTDFHLV
jgi:hypothetical protein